MKRALQPAPPPEALLQPVLCFGEGGWQEEPSTESAGALRSFSALTLNTWFEAPHAAERAAGLVDLVASRDDDVVFLQEVRAKVAERLRADPDLREEVDLVESDGVRGSYGVLVASRLPVARAWELELPSIMNRSLLVVEVATDRGLLALATVHLESTGDQGPARAAQLKAIFEALDGYERVLLAGDFNFPPGAPEEEALDARYVDAWQRLRPEDPGFTVDSTANPMRRRYHGREKRARIDKVLARGLAPERVGVVGDVPLAGDVFLSDHFGVEATLRLP